MVDLLKMRISGGKVNMANQQELNPEEVTKNIWFERFKKFGAIAIVASIYIWSARSVEFDLIEIVRDFPVVINLLGDMIPPNWAYTARIVAPLIETIQIAILGTFIGAIFAIPMTLLAANNVNKNKPLYFITKGIMNFIRTIPQLLYASVLVAGIGLGAFAGMIALVIFSTAVIAKLTSESLEAIDYGPIEALQATGAGKLETIVYAVIPQILPAYASYSLYVFEINIRVSTVLGLVGAGGIGVPLNTSLQLFRYQNASIIILVTFIFVMLIDYTSTRLREVLI